MLSVYLAGVLIMLGALTSSTKKDREGITKSELFLLVLLSWFAVGFILGHIAEGKAVEEEDD